MRYFLLAILFISPITAFSAIQGSNDGTNLGQFHKLDCSTGITCTKSGGKLTMIQATELVEVGVSAGDTVATVAQCGATFISTGKSCVDLPEASTADGCKYTFILNSATEFTIAPDAADQILLLTDSAGDSIKADAQGESIVLQAVDGTNWAPVAAEKGTWSDVD